MSAQPALRTMLSFERYGSGEGDRRRKVREMSRAQRYRPDDARYFRRRSIWLLRRARLFIRLMLLPVK